MRDQDEVQEEFDEAVEMEMQGNNPYPAMSYRDGVKAALAWVLEESEDKPISEDY